MIVGEPHPLDALASVFDDSSRLSDVTYFVGE